MVASAAKLAFAVALLGVIVGCTSGIEGDRGAVPLSSAAEAKLARMGSNPGAPMMIRVYKQESELEVWKQIAGGAYRLFDTYQICAWAGDVGPKLREGDRQVPEGFYTVNAGLLNPRSQYHLAINLGYPNAYDRTFGRTGSNIMIHGECSSRGCLAMTNDQIEEIYALARETLAGGNRSFQVQVYPFRMTAENFAAVQDSRNLEFWNNLKLGYDVTEVTGKPPAWDVCEGKYTFNTDGGCGASTMNEGQRRRLAQLQASDTAALRAAIAAHQEEIRLAEAEAAQKLRDELAAAERRDRREAAAEDRRETIAGAAGSVAGFFGNLFGFGGVEQSARVEDPNAPVPPPRPARLS